AGRKAAVRRRAVLLEPALRRSDQLRGPRRGMGRHQHRRRHRPARLCRALPPQRPPARRGVHLSRRGKPPGRGGDGACARVNAIDDTEDERMPSAMTTPLAIDVVSDIVCPWCFIGKRKLEHALTELQGKEPTLDVRTRWHPFELNPDPPAEGIARASYVERKFGGAERASHAYRRVQGAGEAAGIALRLDRIEQQTHTFDGHRLIAWAQKQGDATPLVERLFQAFFLEGRRIGERGELARLAAECGWPE